MSKQNIRLTTINLALMAMLITSLVAVGWNQVSAQEDGSDQAQPAFHECDFEIFEDEGFWGADGFFEAIKLLGIGEDAVFAQLDDGKSWAEIAEANEVDPQKIVEVMAADEEAFINELLEAGEITAEEAEEWKAESAKFIEFDVFNGWTDPFTIARKALGMDEDAFWEALDGDKSVADLATEKGIDPQTIIDAIVKAENEQIDKQIEAGLVDAEEAEYWRKDIETFAKDIVNEPQGEFFGESLAFESDGFSEAIKLLGIDEEAVFDQLDSGKSWAEIAEANGVDPQAIVNAMVVGEEAFINELLEAGDITAEEAKEWKADSLKYIEFDVFNGWTDPFTVAREALGMDEETFWTALESEKSVADLATEKGIDPQTIIDAIVKAENELIDKQIEAGLIDEDEAEYWRKDVENYAKDIVNETQSVFFGEAINLDELEGDYAIEVIGIDDLDETESNESNE